MPTKFNPQSIYPPIGKYYNLVELDPGERLIISAGIVGIDENENLVEGPTAQIDQAWKNVASVIKELGLTRENLVKMTLYLTRREHIDICSEAHIRHLGPPQDCAVTGVIVELFDPDLYIEIEIYLAKPADDS